jgi:hypothetical protein
MTKRRTAPEIIGIHLGWDMAEVSDGRYQQTVYANPAIYVCGDDYWAAPSNNRAPKKPEGNWREDGEHHGRKVFRLSAEEAPKGGADDLVGADGHLYSPMFGTDGNSCDVCGRAKVRHKRRGDAA